MPRLKDPQHPPALFYVLQADGRPVRIPKSGYVGHMGALTSKVREFYLNNLQDPPDSLEELIVEQVCSRNPKECYFPSGQQPSQRVLQIERKVASQRSSKSFDISRLIQGTKDFLVGARAVTENLIGDTVDQVTVESRASICRDCPQAKYPDELKAALDSCQSCGGKTRKKQASERTLEAAKALCSIGGATIPPDLEEKACGVCGCFMVCLLPVKGETLELKQDSIEQDSLRPDFCWARQYVKPPVL